MKIEGLTKIRNHMMRHLGRNNNYADIFIYMGLCYKHFPITSMNIDRKSLLKHSTQVYVTYGAKNILDEKYLQLTIPLHSAKGAISRSILEKQGQDSRKLYVINVNQLKYALFISLHPIFICHYIYHIRNDVLNNDNTSACAHAGYITYNIFSQKKL